MKAAGPNDKKRNKPLKDPPRASHAVGRLFGGPLRGIVCAMLFPDLSKSPVLPVALFLKAERME